MLAPNETSFSGLAMLTFLLLTGCGGDLSGFIPTIQFSRFDVTDLDFDHIDTDFVFTVDNPNPVGAPLDRFQYDLSLMDVSIISGDDPNGLELVADGESEVALPVSLVFENVYDAITATRGEDNVGFGLAGAFGFAGAGSGEGAHAGFPSRAEDIWQGLKISGKG